MTFDKGYCCEIKNACLSTAGIHKTWARCRHLRLPFPALPSGDTSGNQFLSSIPGLFYPPLLLELVRDILNSLHIHSIVRNIDSLTLRSLSSTKNSSGFYTLFHGLLIWSRLPLKTAIQGVGTPESILPVVPSTREWP